MVGHLLSPTGFERQSLDPVLKLLLLCEVDLQLHARLSHLITVYRAERVRHVRSRSFVPVCKRGKMLKVTFVDPSLSLVAVGVVDEGKVVV